MPEIRSHALLLTLACVVFLGCRKPSTEGVASRSSETVPEASSRPAVATASNVAASASSSPVPSTSAPPTAAEREALARYSAALGRGRVLTKKGDFAGATKAFDEALEAIPHDARAVSERGYAKLQGDDLDGAERDFYEALARSPDPKVLSAVTHNLSLVAARRNNPALASELEDAARDQRKPAAPAGAQCNVEVKRGKAVAADGEMKRVKTLREARAEVAAWNASHLAPPLDPKVLAADDEDTIKRVWLGDGASPWDVVSDETHHLLAGSPGDYRLRLGAASRRAGRCGSTQSLRVDLAPVPSATSFYYDFGFGLVCPNGALPQSGNVDGCSTGCVGPSWNELQTIVFDPSTLEPLLEVDYTDTHAKDAIRPAIAFVAKNDGVQIVGGGCNRFEPLRKLPLRETE